MSFDRLADYAIGLKLRALRTGRNTTLAQLAAETGLSTGLLSKLETDRMIPTLQTLERISRAYGIDLGYFFASRKISQFRSRAEHSTTTGSGVQSHCIFQRLRDSSSLKSSKFLQANLHALASLEDQLK